MLEQEVGEGALRQHHPSQSHADPAGSALPARLSLIPEEGREEESRGLHSWAVRVGLVRQPRTSHGEKQLGLNKGSLQGHRAPQLSR